MVIWQVYRDDQGYCKVAQYIQTSLFSMMARKIRGFSVLFGRSRVEGPRRFCDWGSQRSFEVQDVRTCCCNEERSGIFIVRQFKNVDRKSFWSTGIS